MPCTSMQGSSCPPEKGNPPWWRCCSAELGQEHLIFSILWFFLFFPALPARLSPLITHPGILTSLHQQGREGRKKVKEQERLMLPAVLCWKPTMVPPALVRGWETDLWAFYVIFRGLTLTERVREACLLRQSSQFPVNGHHSGGCHLLLSLKLERVKSAGNTFSPKTERTLVTKSKLMLLSEWLNQSLRRKSCCGKE